MKENFGIAFAALLKHEGGYVNNPADPGGMTNLGVTKRVWEEWVGRESNEKEMRGLTPSQVGPLYRRKYWDKVSGDYLPVGLDLAVFDCAVNAGPGRAVKLLQACLGVPADGFIGPQTLNIIRVQNDPKKLIADYNAARLAFLKELPTFTTFGRGWAARVAAVNNESLAMTA